MDNITRTAWLRQYFFGQFPEFGLRATNNVDKGIGHASLDAICNGKYTHVQAEPYNCYSSIILDIDYNYMKAAYETLDLETLPVPNLAVMNPQNGHAHLVFVLATPVHNNKPTNEADTSSTKAVKYYKRVMAGLGMAYGADMSYKQGIVKNPCSPQWLVDIAREQPYTLDELAGWVYIPDDEEIEKAVEKSKGEGRNCTLFEMTASYAHRMVHSVHDLDEFKAKVKQFAQQRNCAVGDMFSKGAMDDREVNTIVQSVVNWTWNNYRLPEVQWKEWCSAQGRKGNLKSVEVRKAKKEGRKAGVLQLLATGKYTQKQMADLLGIDVKTIKRYVAEDRTAGRRT